MKTLFWLQVVAIGYAYLGYPLLLRALAALRGVVRPRAPAPAPAAPLPSLTMIIPVHNEEAVIAAKLSNCVALDYPRDRLDVLVVSDGSTDKTTDIVDGYAPQGIRLLAIGERGGKARALNHGLAHASGEIVCFSDASIMLEPGALCALAANFADLRVGCASGEDVIRGGGGEKLYGLYELSIRRLESSVASIVGASGSFYAQRRSLCAEFPEGLAPDFLSVLNTVDRGYRAISEPAAVGTMTSLDDSQAEFRRKVRTILRGIATLRARAHLMNPLRYGLFALLLFSHKLMRWSVPFFLLLLLVANAFLLDDAFYATCFAAQILFYLLAFFGWRGARWATGNVVGKIAVYFTVVNVATLVAWWKFASGARQEIWSPTRRGSARP